MLKWLHSMRAGKAIFSEKRNPWMFLIARWAAAIQSARMAVDNTNPFVPLKRAAGRTISQLLDGNRTSRDTVSKELFKTIYVVPKK